MNQESPTSVPVASAVAASESLVGALEREGALEVWRHYIESFDGLRLFTKRFPW